MLTIIYLFVLNSRLLASIVDKHMCLHYTNIINERQIHVLAYCNTLQITEGVLCIHSVYICKVCHIIGVHVFLL